MPNARHLTLSRFIDSAARSTPEAAALVAPDRATLTYAGLSDLVSRTARSLRALGLAPGDRVALVIPQGPEAVTAFLAVASRCAVAPLNPAYREEEFEFYLPDLRARALVVEEGFPSASRDVARRMGLPVVELAPMRDREAGVFELSGDAGSGSRSELEPDPRLPEPEDVALLLHTSGTTSRPKLVPLSHANLCQSAQAIGQTLELSARDRCLSVMPLFHIHGLVGAVLSSISAGASIACAPAFSAPGFFDCMETFRPTWYTAVPTMHQAIVEHAPSRRDAIDRVPLRFIRSSSSALPPAVMADLERVFSAPVIESYGMTEAAHQMASNPLPPRQRKPGSAGVAAGPEVAIMDAVGNILSPGEVGEIVIRGPSVTRGYENNPEANESAFSSGWFRTGDQGYLDADGYVFITGRLKEIVNRGGEKIAPREIDEALLGHADISQAVAFAVPHPSLGEDVAAAVVLRDGSALTEPEIRDFLFDRLADFKVPSQVLIVEEIPKGSTGKLQRVGLAKKLDRKLQRGFVAPEGELETMIAGFFAEVLGIARVSAEDNFFALGGDSLRATQVVARIRSAFHINLPIVTLFRKPTVAELAAEVAAQSECTDDTLIAGIVAELDGLSDEEARRLLDQDSPTV